jgi:hypothetical protein
MTSVNPFSQFIVKEITLKPNAPSQDDAIVVKTEQKEKAADEEGDIKKEASDDGKPSQEQLDKDEKYWELDE